MFPLAFSRSRVVFSVAVLGLCLGASPSFADSVPTTSDSTPKSPDRYGPFGIFDHRSIYGQDWFPEPLATDEADVDNELRADWFHGENHGRQFNSVAVEIEKSFGLLTLEVAPSWESDHQSSFDPDTGLTDHDNEEGFGNVELGARHPIFQYVSPDGFFDTTFVAGMEVTIPTHTRISKDFELVPKLFDLTKIGDHLSIQTGFGDSILVGPEGKGEQTLEYDVVFGYELTKKQLPIPGILSTVPIFELDGERTLNHEDQGHNELFGTVGFRLNFDSISWLPAQPRIGLGYQFPIDKGARDDLRWGIVMSVVFEY